MYISLLSGDLRGEGRWNHEKVLEEPVAYKKPQVRIAKAAFWEQLVGSQLLGSGDDSLLSRKRRKSPV